MTCSSIAYWRSSYLVWSTHLDGIQCHHTLNYLFICRNRPASTMKHYSFPSCSPFFVFPSLSLSLSLSLPLLLLLTRFCFFASTHTSPPSVYSRRFLSFLHYHSFQQWHQQRRGNGGIQKCYDPLGFKTLPPKRPILWKSFRLENILFFLRCSPRRSKKKNNQWTKSRFICSHAINSVRFKSVPSFLSEWWTVIFSRIWTKSNIGHIWSNEKIKTVSCL